MSQPPAPKPHALIPSITGLRGVCALLVVWSHMDTAGMLPAYTYFAGQIGVAVFFCLSGFLMAMLYLRKAFDAKAVGRYVVARAARIAPAYLFVVVVSFFIFWLLDPHFIYPIKPAALFRHLIFSGNVDVLWSIPPEVQFYGLFIALWYATQSFLVRGTWIWLLSFGLGTVVLFLMRESVPGTFVGSKLHFFVLGVCAGLIRSYLRPSTVRVPLVVLGQTAALVIFVLTIGGIVPLTFADREAFYLSPLPALVASFCVLCFSFASPISRLLLENRPALALGTWSFSIYLLNHIVIYWFGLDVLLDRRIDAVAIIAGVLALSYLCNRLIELPGAALIREAAQALPRWLRQTPVAGIFPEVPSTSPEKIRFDAQWSSESRSALGEAPTTEDGREPRPPGHRNPTQDI